MAYSTVEGNRGQGLIEYALILLFIVIVVLAVFSGIGSDTYSKYSRANSAILSASE